MGKSKRKREISSSEDSDSSPDEFEILKLQNRLLKRKLKLRKLRRLHGSGRENGGGHGRNKRKRALDVEESDNSSCGEETHSSEGDTGKPSAADPLQIEFVDVPDLSTEVLDVLGTNTVDAEPTAPSIHRDLASRWTNIIQRGLDVESASLLLTKYPSPQNCALTPPTINPEIAAAMDEQSKKRDERLIKTQKHLAAALSALGKVLSTLLREEAEGGGANRSPHRGY